MELALTGDPFPAERFHELGLVNRLAEPGERRRRGAASSRRRSGETDRLRCSPPSASCRSSSTGPAARCGSASWRSQGPVLASEDAKEGAAAFKEKREPGLARALATGRRPARRSTAAWTPVVAIGLARFVARACRGEIPGSLLCGGQLLDPNTVVSRSARMALAGNASRSCIALAAGPIFNDSSRRSRMGTRSFRRLLIPLGVGCALAAGAIPVVASAHGNRPPWPLRAPGRSSSLRRRAAPLPRGGRPAQRTLRAPGVGGGPDLSAEDSARSRLQKACERRSNRAHRQTPQRAKSSAQRSTRQRSR